MFDNVYAQKVERNSASSREQNALLSHASTKQRDELQCEALKFSDKHKCLYDLN